MNSGMASSNSSTMHRRHMMMHMTFFWGKNTEVLFDGWPGYDNLGMYVLSLAVVFFLSLLVEWLSHCRVIRRTSCHGDSVAAGLLQTLMYTFRVGLGYMVMLAVMSFNGGVLLAAIAGHAVGFFFFGSMVFMKSCSLETDLPPVNCC